MLRGHARVVVGTRASAFAPVRDLGLVVAWDEGDDLHQEPRAPYPHVREVLLAPLGPGEFVVKTGGPGADMATAALDMKLHEGLHLVRGQVDGP